MVTNAARDPFEALGDPNRRDILRLLSEGDKPVSQIVTPGRASIADSTPFILMRFVLL